MLYGNIKGFIVKGKPIQKALVQMLGRFFIFNKYLLPSISNIRAAAIE